MRILVTNDDGIAAPALPLLAARLARDGHNVTVAAPLAVQSGCGASIGQVTEGEAISVARVVLPGAEEVAALSVDAPPAFIVLAAVQGFFGPAPELVVSGPNTAFNLGPLVLHSGTLGAAVTAAANGLPGIALSSVKRARFGYASAAEFCALNLDGLLDLIESGTALNINVPDLLLGDMAGVRITELAPKSLVDIILKAAPLAQDTSAGESRVIVRLDYDADGLMHRRWREGQSREDVTDAGAVLDRCISLTPIRGGLGRVQLGDRRSDWKMDPGAGHD